ncbi:MAG: hypothetical protein R2856_13740 [Caldilineaceae bacterium]
MQSAIARAVGQLLPQSLCHLAHATVTLLEKGVGRRDAGERKQRFGEPSAVDELVGVERLQVAVTQDVVAPPQRIAPRRIVQRALTVDGVLHRAGRKLRHRPAQQQTHGAPALVGGGRHRIEDQRRHDQRRIGQRQPRQREDAVTVFEGQVDPAYQRRLRHLVRCPRRLDAVLVGFVGGQSSFKFG